MPVKCPRSAHRMSVECGHSEDTWWAVGRHSTGLVVYSIEYCISKLQQTYDDLRKQNSAKNALLKSIEDYGILRWRRRGEPTYVPCDELAMACAINSNVIVEKTSVYATVEYQGQHTKGQMVVDWNQKLNKDHNVFIVTEMNVKLYLSMLENCVK